MNNDETGNTKLRSALEERLEKAKAWVCENVPKHTQAEYEELANRNHRMFLKMVEAEQQLESLSKAYNALHEEIWASERQLMPAVTAEAMARVMTDTLDTHVRVTWDIPPYRATVAVRSLHLERYKHDAYPETVAAIKRMFEQEYVPQLWEQTLSSLAYVAAGGR